MRSHRTGPSAGLCVVVCLVIFTAGCVGILGLDDGGTESTRTPGTTADPPTATPTATPDPVDPDNPFGQRHLPVAINGTVEGRDVEPIVERALRYWENNSERYAGYPVNFTLVPPAADHRIAIAFEGKPIACDSDVDDHTTGCAVFNEQTAPPVSRVQVATNHTDHYTFETLVHELGHTLGLDHEDEPRRFMATPHPVGLARETVGVHVTATTGDVTDRQRRGVRTALSYFETTSRLASDERLDWTEVDAPERADFVVEFADGDERCFEDRAGSCPGEPTYDDQQKLVLDGLDDEVVAWHVAFHLAPVFFEPDEVPSELTADASRPEREHWDG